METRQNFIFFNKQWEILGHVHLWMELMQYVQETGNEEEKEVKE